MLDIRELMNLKEAYAEVYAPKELTEEQVWEEVEYWVNSLLEEGYDLSDYTWEEMYEAYLSEGLLDDVKTDMRNSAAQKTVNRALSGGSTPYKSSSDGKNYNNYNDALAAKNSRDPRGAQGRQAQDDLNRVYRAGGGDAAVKGGTKLGGLLNVPGKSPMDVMVQGAKNLPPKYPTKDIPTPTPAPGLPKVNQRPGAPAPTPASPAAPKPSATPTSTTAPKPSATPTSTTAPKPAALTPMQQFAKANPKLAAAQAEKDRIRGTSQTDNPLMKDMKDRMPMTPSVQSPTLAKDLGTGSGNQSLLDNPNASKAATPKKPIVSGFDMFDVVKGYLIGEGYADTEEAALAIMANMSEDWRDDIISEGPNYDKNRQRAAKRAAERNAARDAGKTGNVPGVGYVTPRRERETYRDAAGVERHTSGARMPKKDEGDK